MQSGAVVEAPQRWEDMHGMRMVIPAMVVHRSFAAETVLLNVETGYYHGLDQIGGTFFEVMRQSPTLAEAAVALAAEYEQPVERIHQDLAAFCVELRDRGLIMLEPVAT
jgi:hypothetical protein